MSGGLLKARGDFECIHMCSVPKSLAYILQGKLSLYACVE